MLIRTPHLQIIIGTFILCNLVVAILLEGFEERAREEEEGLRLTTQGSHKSKALNTLKASMQAMLLDKYQFMWDKWRWATFDDPDESRFLQWPVSGDQHSPGGIRLDVPVPPNPHLGTSVEPSRQASARHP